MPPALRSSDTSACSRVWLKSIGVLCQALEVRNNLVGRRWWKSETGVTATTTLFPHVNSRLHLGTLSHLALWNKLMHGLYLFQFATNSLVLPMSANILDRSRHFEFGTFLNRRHYRNVRNYSSHRFLHASSAWHRAPMGPSHTWGRTEVSEPLKTQHCWHFHTYSVWGNVKFVSPMYKLTPMPPLCYGTVYNHV